MVIMIIRNLKKNFYVFPLFLIFLLFSCRVWEAQPLIVPLPNLGFIDYTEVISPLMILIPISFSLYNKYEIELGLVCGFKTTKLMIAKIASILIYAFFSLYAMIVLYSYKPFEVMNGEKIIFPIAIPANYKLYMFLSVTVTVIFFTAVYLFLRVITRNCFIPVGIGLLIYLVFSGINQNIHYGMKSISLCLFDPFISNYFLGNEVPNILQIASIHNIWTYNRLLFAGIAVLLFVLTYLLLRREKLHEVSGD